MTAERGDGAGAAAATHDGAGPEAGAEAGADTHTDADADADAGPWVRRARAPAHVTGFFEIVDDVGSHYRQGSRGAGLNLDLHIESELTIHPDGDGLDIFIDGVLSDAVTTRSALRHLLGTDYPARVEVRIDTGGLPSGQGFGLSGAGTLASCLALADLTGLPMKRGLWSAHRAEVKHRTGLGDVPAQFVGGAEIRVTPGALPMGVVERFAGLESRKKEVVCCVLDGPGLSTSSVLGDAARRTRINDAGREAVDQLRADPTLSHYVRLSRDFAAKVGLIDDALEAALQTADAHGLATQTMLGRALHVIVDPEEAQPTVETLAAHGRTWRTRIAARGAHVVREPAAPRNA